jgi:thymidylate synthase ThyX
MEKARTVIKSCCKRGHTSCLEHAHLSVELITDIGTYKALTRHRHTAFTIESTIYTNYEQCSFIVEEEDKAELVPLLAIIEEKYLALKKEGKHFQARDILPQCTGARLVMTANLREWMFLLNLRITSKQDSPRIRQLCTEIARKFTYSYPFFFCECYNEMYNTCLPLFGFESGTS